MADPRYAVFKHFLILRKKDIQRIANHTRGEYTVADVESEAWLTACRLVGTADITVTLSEPEFQQNLLRYLYQGLVKYKERKFRNPVRLDHKDEDGPDKYDLISASNAEGVPDPMAVLITLEDAVLQDDDPHPHDTQAGAFLDLLRRYNGTVRDLAEYLRISVSHCYRCLANARQLARSQGSIWLGIARDDPRLRRWRNCRVQRTESPANASLHGQRDLFL